MYVFYMFCTSCQQVQKGSNKTLNNLSPSFRKRRWNQKIPSEASLLASEGIYRNRIRLILSSKRDTVPVKVICKFNPQRVQQSHMRQHQDRKSGHPKQEDQVSQNIERVSTYEYITIHDHTQLDHADE